MALSSGDGVPVPRAIAGSALEPAKVDNDCKPDVHAGDVADLGATPHTDEAHRRRGNLDRRLADEALVGKFAADDFSGPAYRNFQIELVRYGLAVMRAWLYSGRAFTLLNERQIWLRPTVWELERLHRDPDARGEIADFTIARALPIFEEKALRQGGWQASGGASLPTYFIGSSLYQVPNPFRQWSRHERRHSQLELHEAPEPAATYQNVDPATQACNNDMLLRTLNRVPEKQRQALLLSTKGYRQSEIKEILGLTSERAVEGLIHRARTNLKQITSTPVEGGR
ncbi:RNA polymerase sigma factor [Glycomyces niveus]|uniref:RNA polymerase sigma factor 70 region 4 type 2 domain-containing protein n=1 Tax=Glycomyces niveus TaxID=2820287 RepID=A0ABS3U1W6_9ACTN|nr:sigma factor-like helix-turn-helix DNA-binding protein [Glycomyces sp. NEAU-S30]MBO3732764.1 hypothetical protein [Glycomyces sp. NEAU-S30]